MTATRRLLRTYEHVAQKNHGSCSLCEIPIFPGDPYIGMVWACQGRITTEKFHNGCPIDPDEDARLRLELPFPKELPLAA